MKRCRTAVAENIAAGVDPGQLPASQSAVIGARDIRQAGPRRRWRSPYEQTAMLLPFVKRALGIRRCQRTRLQTGPTAFEEDTARRYLMPANKWWEKYRATANRERLNVSCI